jgi:hypothetical protein
MLHAQYIIHTHARMHTIGEGLKTVVRVREQELASALADAFV